MRSAACCRPPSALRPGTAFSNQDDVDTLTFIRRARALDLPLDDIGTILTLRRAGPTPCGAVRDLLDARIAEIDNTITELLALRASLTASRDTAVAADTESEPNRSICPIIER